MRSRRIWVGCPGLFLAGLLALGCGGSDGPKRYQIHGTVTYKGKPVPKGFITFLPDTSKGNSGPGGGAPIVNGEYQTPDGKGIVGGPHFVKIVGYDGVPTRAEGEELPDGTPLFIPYEKSFDFPKEDTKKDFPLP